MEKYEYAQACSWPPWLLLKPPTTTTPFNVAVKGPGVRSALQSFLYCNKVTTC